MVPAQIMYVVNCRALYRFSAGLAMMKYAEVASAASKINNAPDSRPNVPPSPKVINVTPTNDTRDAEPAPDGHGFFQDHP